LAAARGEACPLRYEPVLEQAAAIVTRTTNEYLSQSARAVPIDKDPVPVIRDLGYTGNTARLLLGAGKTDAEAIKGALLEGYSALVDCSYRDFGVNVSWNDAKKLYLTTALLAGP
jgi:hypothetical protein